MMVGWFGAFWGGGEARARAVPVGGGVVVFSIGSLAVRQFSRTRLGVCVGTAGGYAVKSIGSFQSSYA